MTKRLIRTLCVIGILSILGFQEQPVHAMQVKTMPVYASESADPSFEENLRDTLLTLLTPALDQAVKSVYGEPKQFDLFNAKINRIDRPQKGGFHFIVDVTIQTFEGAHNPPYGKDTFTFDVTPEKTTLLKSTHIEVPADL